MFDSPGICRLAPAKTGLAVRWLDAHHGRHPDGVLHVDLNGWSGHPPPAISYVLAGWLRALGVAADDLPGDAAELVALYRTITADKAVAVHRVGRGPRRARRHRRGPPPLRRGHRLLHRSRPRCRQEQGRRPSTGESPSTNRPPEARTGATGMTARTTAKGRRTTGEARVKMAADLKKKVECGRRVAPGRGVAQALRGRAPPDLRQGHRRAGNSCSGPDLDGTRPQKVDRE